jgi:ankyrin repeat protein
MIDATSKRGLTPLHYAIYCNERKMVQLLIYRGASLSNVKMDIDVPLIPDWVHKIVSARLLCRRAAITLIGIHQFHSTCVTGSNDVNVIRHISKHIWSSRMDKAWVMTNDGEKTE